MQRRIAVLIAIAAMVLVWLGTAVAVAPDCTTNPCVYLPLLFKPGVPPTPSAMPTDTPTPTRTPTRTPTPTMRPTMAPTATPTLPPPSFDGCQEDPNPAIAPNYPVRIVAVFKSAVPEVVRLQNVSLGTVNLNGWHMCSIIGNQEHTGIGGTLAPGETKDYPYTGAGFIWNNTSSDPGALYNTSGQLVSYWNN